MAKTERIFTAELTIVSPEENTEELTQDQIRSVGLFLAMVGGFDHVKITKVQDHTFPDQEKPMRVYISGPISNNPYHVLDFKDAERYLTEQGYEAINPAALNSQLPEMKYEEYMKVDMTLLPMCDAIYLLKGWEQSRGANRELGYAMAAGMKIMREGEE